MIPKHYLHHLCSGPLEKESREMQFTSDFPSDPSSLNLLNTIVLHFNFVVVVVLLFKFSSP